MAELSTNRYKLFEFVGARVAADKISRYVWYNDWKRPAILSGDVSCVMVSY